jgi:transcriptional regulator with XRE-family HTH domain
MAKRKPRIRHAEIVGRFASRLRELRHSRGLTQADLAQRARITVSYVWRLETGGAAPGIDLVDRLATALGTSVQDLLPGEPPVDSLPLLREQAEKLFQSIVASGKRDAFLMLNPLLACVAESLGRRV